MLGKKKKKKKCTVGASRIGGYISPECAFWFIYGAQVCVMHVAGCITPYTYGRIWWEQHSLACSCSTGMCVMPVAEVSLHTAGAAMSTFSPIGSWCSNGISVCVCVCVCGWDEPDVYTTLAYSHISLFRTMPVLYTSTRTHPFSNHLRIANRRG